MAIPEIYKKESIQLHFNHLFPESVGLKIQQKLDDLE